KARPMQKPSPSLSLSASAGQTSSRLQTPSPSGSTSWQVLEQQSSVPFAAPWSHCSPPSTTPLPHDSRVQLLSQPSPSLVLPSSHCSPGSRKPSPQEGAAGRVEGTQTRCDFWTLSCSLARSL